jgi:glycosyltransferase involved in cell wall biosynthesis
MVVKNMIYVSHFVGMSGIGGVQRNFTEYLNSQAELGQLNNLLHKVYTLGEVDSQYILPVTVYNIKNPRNFISLVLDIISRKNIVHFYNNLTSFKMALFLFLLPVCNIILHERGTVWNLPSSRGVVLRFVAWKASFILANSSATRVMLEKKFRISNSKIIVLHNGIDTSVECIKKNLIHKNFRVGFIGRLDTPKGVHVLIEAMHHLANYDIELIIAGDGILEDALKIQADGPGKISFIGRVSDPYRFLRDLDLLVVPSIREPLGNVCLEAGLCKVPVLATNVDGIPEIIKNGVTGELINATDEVSISASKGSVPLPEFVVNPVTKDLQTPRQINSSLLAERILKLSSNPDKLKYYANGLHNRVMSNFCIEKYAKKLNTIYCRIDGNLSQGC